MSDVINARLQKVELALDFHMKECNESTKRVAIALDKFDQSSTKLADAVTASALAATESYSSIHMRIDKSIAQAEGARKDLRIALLTTVISILGGVVVYLIINGTPWSAS